jgi:hypothetical protein
MQQFKRGKSYHSGLKFNFPESLDLIYKYVSACSNIHFDELIFLHSKLDMQLKFQHFQSFYRLSSEPIPLLLPFQP